jgi:hypothetical protein
MKKMIHILERDRTGICTEGECKNLIDQTLKRQQEMMNIIHVDTDVDLVLQAGKERQALIEKEDVHSPDSYPDATWTSSRTEAPGFWGGHC